MRATTTVAGMQRFMVLTAVFVVCKGITESHGLLDMLMQRLC